MASSGFHIIRVFLPVAYPAAGSSKYYPGVDCGSVNWKIDLEAFKSHTTILPFSLALARMCGTILFQLMAVIGLPSWKFGSPGLNLTGFLTFCDIS